MASLDDVVTIPDLRHALGVVSTDDDARIGGHRASAVALIESYTSRNILTRQVTGESSALPAQDMIFYVPDVQDAASWTLRYRRPEDDPGFATTASVDVRADQVRVRPDHVILRPDADGWPEIQRGNLYSVEFTCGMDSDGVPEVLKEATGMLVRVLYEGSAMDAIPRGSLVGAMIAPYSSTLIPGPGAWAGAGR